MKMSEKALWELNNIAHLVDRISITKNLFLEECENMKEKLYHVEISYKSKSLVGTICPLEGLLNGYKECLVTRSTIDEAVLCVVKWVKENEEDIVKRCGQTK